MDAVIRTAGLHKDFSQVEALDGLDLELFDLDPSKKGRAYSKGNRQKVALVAALATDAELYLLDEPTSGLDPLMEAVFMREIRLLVQENGATRRRRHREAERTGT